MGADEASSFFNSSARQIDPNSILKKNTSAESPSRKQMFIGWKVIHPQTSEPVKSGRAGNIDQSGS